MRNLLLKDPHEQTITYAVIANLYYLKHYKKISVQAIDNVVKQNLIMIIVFCHQVIGINNKLIGYSANLKKHQKDH